MSKPLGLQVVRCPDPSRPASRQCWPRCSRACHRSLHAGGASCVRRHRGRRTRPLERPRPRGGGWSSGRRGRCWSRWNWSEGVLLDAPGGLLQGVGFAGFSAAAPEHQQGQQHGDEDQSGDDCVGSGQVGSEVQPVVHRAFAAFALGQRGQEDRLNEVRSKTSSTGVTAMYHPVELVSSGKAAAVMRKNSKLGLRRPRWRFQRRGRLRWRSRRGRHERLGRWCVPKPRGHRFRPPMRRKCP